MEFPDQKKVDRLSFSICDELVSSERIESMTFKEVVGHRRVSDAAREEFLQYLATIQAKQASEPLWGPFMGKATRSRRLGRGLRREVRH